MSENNNTTLIYKSQTIDLDVLSVLDVTEAGKVVSAKTWKNLWDLVLNRINKFDEYCVEVCNSINAWDALKAKLEETSLKFTDTAVKLESQFNAVKAGLVHYGKSEPENQNIVLWAQPIDTVDAVPEGSVDGMVIARTDAVLDGIVSKYLDTYLTDLNIPSKITTEVNNKVNGLKLVGKRGDVASAEVFNNYNTNKAMAEYASASGNSTVAGTRCFHLQTYGTNTHVLSNYINYAKAYANETQRLICGNDEYIILATTDGTCVQRGFVSRVTGNTIIVTPSEYALPTSKATDYCFILLNKPLCGNITYGSNAQASGLQTKSLADNARSVGYYTKALAMNATAEGSWTEAMGVNSHSEGYKTKALKMTAHAEGWTTQAIGNNSHSEGVLTEAIGSQAHAEGWETKVTGTNSHAEGRGTIAEGNEQHVSGRYNVPNKTALLIVGNGSEVEGVVTRSNAFEIDQNGTAILPALKGPNGNPDPTAIGTSEYSVVTKGYVRQFVNSQLAGYSAVITSLQEQIAVLNRDIDSLSHRIALLEGGV